MKKILLLFVSFLVLTNLVHAQQSKVAGRVTDATDNSPIPRVTVSVQGGGPSVATSSNGQYMIDVPTGSVLIFQFVGMKRVERTITGSGQVNVVMESSSESLSDVIVTGALGIKEERRSMGSSVQTVSAADVAGTQRENFIDALQGRVAGLDIIATSGVPGASSSILLRGVSSLSGSNSPLMVIDGLPADNSTQETSDFGGNGVGGISFENRGVDFTNRSSDFNPEDIESITVLKGPEAAALYGIAAANGAIVITTKRGKAGESKIAYSNSFRIDNISKAPEVQRKWGLGRNGIQNTTAPMYFGPEYSDTDTLYDNVSSFFQTALTQKHNLSFEGGADNTSWRLSAAYVDQKGVVPNSEYSRLNLSAATRSQVKDWLGVDVSLNYSSSDNQQPFKGEGGPLIGLLIWPHDDDAKVFLNPDGTRKKYFSETGNEVDNPFFSVNKNKIGSDVNRLYATTGLTIKPVSWLSYDLKIGFDIATTQNQVLRHPESNSGVTRGGLLDEAKRVQKNLTIQGFFTAKKEFGKFNVNGMLGHSTQNNKGNALGVTSENFLDPYFISINNSAMENRYSKSTITDYRIIGLFGRAILDYDRIVYLTLTGRNDWSSTLPVQNNSFFYPSASLALNFTDLPAFKRLNSGVINYGKLRASVAQVGRDARPYKIYPALEFKDVAYGGYGYGFSGPNPDLLPEMVTSWEIGTEMAFLKDRINVDFAYYKKRTKDQIVNNIRSSYGTGFILIDMNGGDTQNSGVELMLSGRPIAKENFKWKTSFNFARSRGVLLSLPRSLPETYNSDTWLYGNVRNGAIPGQPIMSMSGRFYMKNDKGQILINPSDGLPIREANFVSNGTNRWPKWTLGWSNQFSYKEFNLSFLFDSRYGGDVLNATEHYLTARGLSLLTLDRMEPRVVKGVLRDGLENTDNPTQNNLVIIPQYQNAYYINMSEEYYIEKHVNFFRLKDVTLSYALPSTLIKKQKAFKSASAFITATDIFMITNYTGSDPIVNGNTAAVGGSGGIGLDYGNFPIPVGFNLGIRVGL